MFSENTESQTYINNREEIAMIWRIYRYYNPIEDKSYIGQTTNNVNRRIGKHGHKYKKGTPFREAIDKYGLDNFEQSILRLCTSQEEADQYERHFIEKYNTIFPSGYNLQSGGIIHRHIHQITKQKISECSNETMSRPEVIEKISKSVREAWNIPEYRQKQSDSHKGQVTWNKGKKGCFSSETLRVMSINNKGENNPQYGKHWFNDGTKNVSAYSCPEGFVLGRLFEKKCQ